MLWMRKYEGSGQSAMALVDKHRLRKKVKRLTSTVEQVIWTVLKKHFLTLAKNSMQFTYDQLKAALKREVASGGLTQEQAIRP